MQPQAERLPADAGKIRVRKILEKNEGDEHRWPTEIAGVLVQKSGAKRVGYEVTLPIKSQ